ncbi:GNAT family N-acetyltransferase [Vibrio sinensis]|uniref:GNAT family N-acetyltransferase n=1 Tax=Vibrio sinensis TaxID=2302434 RepID=A0A3A6QQE1_9VIBR|nr:GNAT family N-acetyltransferase [Vibrio sinensis]RJX70979.1 GNAT family N-acetyltransferase [Vibrio sinensis]
MNIEFIFNPATEIKDTVLKGLRGFNANHFPHDNSEDIACVTKNDDGEIKGGLTGEIYMNTLFIHYFWLDDSLRGSGMGTQLIQKVEQMVQQRGVTDIYLDTFTFQAREFYLKMGFEEVGRFTGYPMAGVDKIFLQKHL